jgi:hypothetical protein
MGSCAAKDADIGCDMDFDDIGGPPSDFLYLLFTWWTSGEHVSRMIFHWERNTQSEQYEKARN